MHSFGSFLLRAVAIGAAGASVLLGLAGSTPEAKAAGSCAVSDISLDAEERAFVGLINDYRAAHGLSRLTVSESLTRAATWMSTDLADHNKFGHIDGQGRNSQTRIADCGYGGPAGENLAAGTAWDTAAEAMAAWKGSAGHNANMLYASYVQIGVARVYDSSSQYGWYWTTTFGTVADGTDMLGGGSGAARTQVTRPVVAEPLWVNDLGYGSKGGGFYWDPKTGTVWTGERGWHRFAPALARFIEPLWVNDYQYASAGKGFYLDPRSNQVWTAECGWHFYRPSGC